MDELISILRSMRTDADQAIQLLSSDEATIHSKALDDRAAILARIKAWRDELNSLIAKYGDPRDERV
jgi:hypothetical protein